MYLSSLDENFFHQWLSLYHRISFVYFHVLELQNEFKSSLAKQIVVIFFKLLQRNFLMKLYKMWQKQLNMWQYVSLVALYHTLSAVVFETKEAPESIGVVEYGMDPACKL